MAGDRENVLRTDAPKGRLSGVELHAIRRQYVHPRLSVRSPSPRERSNLRGAVRGQPHHDERPRPSVAELAAVGSWPGCRFAAAPTPFPAALPFLGRMHHADCAHVAGGAEPHDGKARNWRLEGGSDRAAPAHRPDHDAAGTMTVIAPMWVWTTISTSQSSNSASLKINCHGAHTRVDLGETAHLPAAPRGEPRLSR